MHYVWIGLTAFALHLLISLTALAAESRISDWLSTQGSLLWKNVFNENTDSLQAQHIRLEPQWLITSGSALQIQLSPQWRWRRFPDSQHTSWQFDGEWNEAYASYTADFWRIRLGRLEDRRGEAIGPSVVDVLNPVDWRDPRQAIDDTDRLGQDLLMIDYLAGEWSWNLYWVPKPRQSIWIEHLDGVDLQASETLRTPEAGLWLSTLLGDGLDTKVFVARYHQRSPLFEVGFSGQPLAPLQLKPYSPLFESAGVLASYADSDMVWRFEAMTSKARENPQALADRHARSIGQNMTRSNQAMLAVDRFLSALDLNIGMQLSLQDYRCTETLDLVGLDFETCQEKQQQFALQARYDWSPWQHIHAVYLKSLRDSERYGELSWQMDLGDRFRLLSSWHYTNLGLLKVLGVSSEEVRFAVEISL